MTDPAVLFDAAVVRRCPTAGVVAEDFESEAFLDRLFVACSPLADVLPEAMLLHQAAIQRTSHNSGYPHAMRRIVTFSGVPAGRIMVDWDAGGAAYGVDIAVLPSFRATAIGLTMLRSWLEVADGLGRECRLDVLADNPARRIYERLGFRICGDADLQGPVLTMKRSPSG